MPSPSRFSTPENYQRLTTAKTQLIEAIHEANMAVQAGIPNAQQALDTAQSGLKSIEQVLSVYFPTGAPSNSSSEG